MSIEEDARQAAAGQAEAERDHAAGISPAAYVLGERRTAAFRNAYLERLAELRAEAEGSDDDRAAEAGRHWQDGREALARELIPLLVRAMHDGDRGAARDALFLAPHSHLSDDDSEAQAAASEQLAQFREGDVLPSWGDRPLTAREAAVLNERPEEYAATRDDLRELARTDHAAFLASLNLRVDEWIELMGSGTPEGNAELSRFAVAVLREDNVDPGQMFARLRRARQRYRGDPGFRAYVDQVAAEWEPPGDQSSDRSEP